MKKDLLTHFLFTVAFFLLATLVKEWFNPAFYTFWLGGLVGMVLPDVDYFIYIYFLNPEKQISQQATALIEKRSLLKSWDLLATARAEHSDLIFHSVYFQIIFLVFAFLVVTSSSLFGRGMVLAFALHLLVDQVTDEVERGGIRHWFSRLNVTLSEKQERWYLIIQVFVLVTLGFVF